MLSKVLSAYVIGVDAHLIEVEVDISSLGLPQFSVVGLPDAAVRESKDRIRPALKNDGLDTFAYKPKYTLLLPKPKELPRGYVIHPETIGGHIRKRRLDLGLLQAMSKKSFPRLDRCI